MSECKGRRHYLSFSNPKGAWSRVQMGTNVPIDIIDYSDVYISTWCYVDSQQTMMVGITKGRFTWMSSPTGNDNSDGGTFAAESPITTDAQYSERVVCDIRNYTGNWYIGVQRVYTNSYNSYYCNANQVSLIGRTYSYTNRGL